MAMSPEDRKFISRLQVDSMLMNELAFVNSLLMQLPLQVSHDENTTVQANDLDLIVNPDYLSTLPKKQQLYAMSQLAWHMALGDPVTVKTAEHKELFNLASDIYIDKMLMEDHGRILERVPGQDPRYFNRNDFDGKSRDEIYRKLIEEQEGNNSGNSGESLATGLANDLTKPKPSDAQGDSDNQDQDGNGGDSQAPQQAPMSDQELKDKLEDLVKNAAMQAKLAGANIPPSIAKQLEAIYNPQVHWATVLERIVGSYKREDYSWLRFNKAYFAHGIVLPTLYNESIGDIVVAVDTSGSISDDAYQHILGNLSFIHANLHPSKLHLVQFTDSIHNTMESEEGDDLNEGIFERVCGGTDVNPVFDWVENQGIKPEVMIVFTDMYMPEVRHDPSYPVVWGVIDNPQCSIPFGERVDIKCH